MRALSIPSVRFSPRSVFFLLFFHPPTYAQNKILRTVVYKSTCDKLDAKVDKNRIEELVEGTRRRRRRRPTSTATYYVKAKTARRGRRRRLWPKLRNNFLIYTARCTCTCIRRHRTHNSYLYSAYHTCVQPRHSRTYILPTMGTFTYDRRVHTRTCNILFP